MKKKMLKIGDRILVDDEFETIITEVVEDVIHYEGGWAPITICAKIEDE